MNRITFIVHDLNDTDRLGAILARSLEDGTTIALIGTLGAGKTRLVQAVAANCGIPSETVVSPTFVLCQEYHGARSIYHFDAYRLKDDEEFQQLGPQEYFASTGLVFIEWADRVQGSLPDERVEIHIEPAGDTEREVEILCIGDRHKSVADALRRELPRDQIR